MQYPEKHIDHPLGESLKKAGYDAEEQYFYRLNTDLIERNRSWLDKQRSAREEQERKSAYWMTCPKCGGQLKETDCYNVIADICNSCSGVFLDHGELEQVVTAHSSKGFMALLKRWLSEATKPRESGVSQFPV